MACNLFVTALAFALAGCGVGVERVDVSGKRDDVRFTVIAAQSAGPACARDLSVEPILPENADLAWQVSSAGIDSCFSTLRYGELSNDITQRVSATPLRPNVDYRVRVSGPGFMMVRDFRLTPNGVTVLN